MKTNTLFTIVIITHNRMSYLKKCLISIHKCLIDPSISFDVKIILNGEDHETENYLNSQDYQFNKIVETTPAQARNLALKNVKTPWILFIDDDTILPKTYFIKALEIIKTKSIDLFGGPDAPPATASSFQRSLSLALKSPLATAHTRARHKKDSSREAEGSESNLILCHLWVKKSIFLKFNLEFDYRFKRNEENIFIEQLQKHTKKISYFSHLYIFHHRKKNFKELFSSISSSGYYRAKSFYYYPESLNIVYFTPLIFLIYLCIIPLSFNLILLIPLLAYFTLNLLCSLYLSYPRDIFLFPRLAIIQFYIVISYGLGTGIFLSRLIISFIFRRLGFVNFFQRI